MRSPSVMQRAKLQRWAVAAGASLSVCGLWFAYLNRDGCWLYWNGPWRLTIFVFPCLWLLLLFGLNMKGRLGLVAISLLSTLFFPHIDTVSKVTLEEVRAVGTLRKMWSVLESQKGQSYPLRLPHTDSAYPFGSTYRFEYVPSVPANRRADNYIVKATPLRRSCGCMSFTIANDGRIYYTREDRPATISDPSL
jgi:hypothetical protein